MFAPTDPAYTRFIDGLKQIASDLSAKGTWRWDAKQQKWSDFPASSWVIEDLGLADTTPEPAIRQWGYPVNAWEIQDYAVADLLARIQKAHASFAVKYSNATLVWSPWGGGDWRNVYERRGSQTPYPAPGKPTRLPDDCVRRIEQVREYERRELITHGQAERIIEGIVAECT